MADDTELDAGTGIVDDDTAAANAAALADIAEKPSEGDAVAGKPTVDPAVPVAASSDVEPVKPPRADKWAIDEITALRAKNREIAAEAANAAQLKAERDHWKALAEQVAAPTATPAAPPAKPVPQAGTDEFQTAVKAEAARLSFLKECEDIAAVGSQSFKDWAETIGIINAIGASSDDFLQDVIAADRANAPALLHELANDPTMARRLVGMDARNRVGALAKMAVKLETAAKPAAATNGAAVTPPKPLSRAPAPMAKLDAGATNTPDTDLYSDNTPDAAWSKAFDKKFALGGAPA